MTFDESEVKRSADGKFAGKTGAAPEVALKSGEIDRGNGIVCDPKASWNYASCRGCGWWASTASREEAAVAVENHRTDPGFEDASIEDRGWYKRYKFLTGGVLHRVGGPAVRHSLQPLGQGDYFQNGVPHRTDGPAVFNGEFDEMNEWWVRGEEVTLSSDEKQAIWDDLDTAFDRLGVTFEDDEYNDKRRGALTGVQRIVAEKVLNERVAGMEKA